MTCEYMTVGGGSALLFKPARSSRAYLSSHRSHPGSADLQWKAKHQAIPPLPDVALIT